VTAYRRYLADNGPGLAGSALMHGVMLLLLLAYFKPVAPAKQEQALRSVLVEIVHLGQETTTTQAKQKAATPAQQASARKAPVAHSPREAVQPHASKPIDDLDNRLNALSKLKAPETATQQLTGPGEAHTDAESDATPGGEAAYALRDYVRAQVMRRWNLNLALLGTRKWIVALHVVMKASGAITEAEVVDKHRYATDAVFRQIALSAKNAVLLSSPIQLPAGNYPPETEMTINLNPRDAMR
jgi:hypothetical protein